MRFRRLLTIVLVAVLAFGWAGAGVAGALPGAPHGASAAADHDDGGDCDAGSGHHGRADRDGQGDHAKPGHKTCCMTACGMSGLAPADFPVGVFGRVRSRVLPLRDDRLRERFVPPLRRPPRPVA